MNLWTKRCLQAGIFVGGMWILGSGIAAAQGTTQPIGHPGTAGISIPITAPVTVSGNAIGILTGRHHQATASNTAPGGAAAGHASGGGTSGAASHHRTLLNAPITAPVTVCGNAVGVLGSARATCSNPAASPSGGGTSSGPDSAGSSAVAVPITAPVTVCGNAAGVLGSARATCENPVPPSGGSSSGGSSGSTGGINVPISVPVTACGNSAGVLGSASAGCGSGTPVVPPVVPTPPTKAPTGASGGSPEQQTQAATADKPAGMRLLAAPATGPSAALTGRLPFTGSALGLLLMLAAGLLLAGSALRLRGRSQIG